MKELINRIKNGWQREARKAVVVARLFAGESEMMIDQEIGKE